MMENLKNTFTKAAKLDASKEELRIKIKNVKAIHTKLNDREKKYKQSGRMIIKQLLNLN